MISEELMPCPFCGGEAKAFYDDAGGVYEVQCQECGAEPYVGKRSIPGMRTLGDVIKAWNRRVGRTCHVEVSHGSHGPEPRFEGDVWTMHHVCSACGGAIDRDDAYCKHCGARVVDDAD